MSAKLIPAVPTDTPTGRAWPAGLVVLLAVLAALFFWGWSRGSDARILARLPAAERARLFEYTRGKAETLCATPDLEDECRAEVELLSKFPECGAECQGFVAEHRARASR